MHLKKIHGALGLLEQKLFTGYWEQVDINNWQFQELLAVSGTQTLDFSLSLLGQRDLECAVVF